jgi:formylglycine-generating enzyme required for sulfatase activity
LHAPGWVHTGTYRVIRGGGWYISAGDLRCADRGVGMPSLRDDYTGFRLSQDN